MYVDMLYKVVVAADFHIIAESVMVLGGCLRPQSDFLRFFLFVSQTAARFCDT